MTGLPPPTPVATRQLLDRALSAYAGDRFATEVITSLQRRLAEPLRVAIAGKLKAGKSTLLNALLGEQVAATDAGECTLVTTWYVHGPTPSARLLLHDGQNIPLALRRSSGQLSIDLGGHRPDEVARIEVTWPSPVLTEMTLIDTPGLGSLTLEASQRTSDLVTGDSGPGVDALIYLMQRPQATDLDLLSDFHLQADHGGGEEHPLNVIGVLSRADELGEGLTGLINARQLAAEYAAEPRLRVLCQQILPVAGLLAEGAQTLRQPEFETLLALSELSRDERELLMISATRFVSSEHPALSTSQRRSLLQRLGLFGIRLALTMVPHDTPTPSTLAEALLRHSGLPDLKTTVLDTYTDSADLLKARSALNALARLLLGRPCLDPQIAHDLEATLLSAHDLRELRLRTRLRAEGVPGWTRTDVQRALRVSGAEGSDAAARLGLAPDADVFAAALEEIGHWQQFVNDPLVTRPARDTALTLIRSCEQILTEVSETVDQ